MRQLFSAIFVLVLACLALPARADDEVPRACVGRNLLEDLKSSDAAAAAAVQKEADAIPNGHAILWKIHPKKGKAASYLMGTAHVTDTRATTLSKEVKDLIAASKVTALELAEVSNRAALQQVFLSDVTRTMMPDGKSIWDVIPDDKEDSVRNHPSLAMMPPDIRDRFQPWMLTMTMAMPMCEMLRKPFKLSVDEVIAQQAMLRNIPIKGLETAEEQLNVLAGASMDEQVQMLLETAALKIPVEDSFQTLVELYLSQNVAAMMPLMKQVYGKEFFAEDSVNMRFMQALLDKRNVNMAERAVPLIEQGGAFIAVGALHLPGEVGVVELLKKKGYKLTPVE